MCFTLRNVRNLSIAGGCPNKCTIFETPDTINKRKKMRRKTRLFTAYIAEIINKCSADTALRDITDLISKRILRKEAAGGRSTGYELNT